MRLHILTFNDKGDTLAVPLNNNLQLEVKILYRWNSDCAIRMAELPTFSCLSTQDGRYHYVCGLAKAKRQFSGLGIEMLPFTGAIPIKPWKPYEFGRTEDLLLPVELRFPPSFQLPREYCWTRFVPPYLDRLPGYPGTNKDLLQLFSLYELLFC